MKEIWAENIDTELRFWASIFAGSCPQKDWVENFRRRAAGIDVAPLYLHEYIGVGKRILDVGSGPATVLGGVLKGNPLNITAVDPLANQYKELYESYGITPLVMPIYGEGENLPSIINGKFDFVYSRNALDHSYDPMRAIQNMIDACADEGVVLFESLLNEGLRENYAGLHQWNFMPASGDLVIWNRDGSAWLAERELCGFKSFSVWKKPGSEARWMFVKIIK